ncbi:MAG: ATP synthase F0 subunit C [Polyangiales bacterium]
MSLKKTFVTTGAVLATLGTSSLAFAQTAVEEVGKAGANGHDVKAMAALAAGIAIGAAALGGTLAQGRATAAALDGIARNPGAAPRIQTPMILGLALIESLVLMGFVVAFLLQGFATK